MAGSLADRLAAGFRLHTAGRLDAAAEQARKLMKQAPELAGAHYLAGLVALDRGKPAQAARHLESAARLGPESAAVRQALGVAWLRSGRASEAAAELRRASALAPAHLPTLLLRGEAELAAGEVEAALASAAQALAIAPDDADALDLRGVLLRRSGKPAAAKACFEAALAQRPGWLPALSHLGACFLDTGEPARALPLLREVAAQAPADRDAARNLGLALEATGAVDAAAELFAALVADGDGEARLALGQLELRRKQFAPAAALFRAARAAAPDSLRAAYGLAEALRESGDAVAAAESYRACLALDPQDAIGAGLGLALLAGGAAAASPSPEFVRALFDAYADRFDRDLTQKLGYRGPDLLRAALAPLLDTMPPPVILDLGCGTGLAGAAFADRAAAIDGIDLSPRMIEQATARGIYRRLVTGDLLAAMKELAPQSYGLLLAADVLVYLGDLAPLFAEVARLLPPHGLFAFTVEHLAGAADYALQPSRRYAHSRRYIERLAAAHFTLLQLDEVSTRSDRGEPVPGLLAVMRLT